MPDIDEVSQALGRMESQNVIMLDAIKDIRDHLKELNGKTASAHTRLDGMVSKKEALKVVLTLGMIGGAGGTGVLKAISVLLGAE